MPFPSTTASVVLNQRSPSEISNYGAFTKDSWNQKYFPVFHRYSHVAPVRRDIQQDFLEPLLANAASEALKYLTATPPKSPSVVAFNGNQASATSKIHKGEEEITQVSTLGKRVALLTGWLVWPFLVPFVVLIVLGIAVFIWYNFIE